MVGLCLGLWDYGLPILDFLAWGGVMQPPILVIIIHIRQYRCRLLAKIKPIGYQLIKCSISIILNNA